MFQKLTDELYASFVADLKQRGIQLVNYADVMKQPVMKANIKQEIRSGNYVELTAFPISNGFEEDGISGRLPTFDLFGAMVKAGYSIYYPSEVPSPEYSLPMGGADDYDIVVLPKNVPLKRMEAAGNLGAGVITVGFEVELMKYDYDACVDKDVIEITHTPMVRTRLTSFNMYPAGSKLGFFGLNTGIVMQPKNRGKGKGTGFLRSKFMNTDIHGTRWIEGGEDAVSISGDDVVPVAGKFPLAFKKQTDAQRQMIMYVIDHQSDF